MFHNVSNAHRVTKHNRTFVTYGNNYDTCVR